MAVCTVLGVIIEGLAYRPLRQAGSLAVLITAIGVSYFLQNGAQLLFGANPVNFTPVISGQLTLFSGRLRISYVARTRAGLETAYLRVGPKTTPNRLVSCRTLQKVNAIQ